ncbi:FAD-dependent oxidoreductase, partial [bacterium]|nr:FAD-dependent oxidoreductase [bacterium]
MLYDLIVIGSGPAGQKAALQGARAGKRVALVDDLPMLGGGCLHWGTMPSKSFRESVYRWSLSSRGTLGRESEHVGRAAGRIQLPDMKRLLKRKERVVQDEAKVIREKFEAHGIRVYLGRARFTSAHDIEVHPRASGKKGTIQNIAGSTIIVATGARPVSRFPVDGKVVLDSNSILSMKRVPRSMVVLGAGIIGCEYASMFS